MYFFLHARRVGMTHSSQDNFGLPNEDYEIIARHIAGDNSAAYSFTPEFTAWLSENPKRTQLLTDLQQAHSAIETHGRQEIALQSATLRNNLESWVKSQSPLLSTPVQTVRAPSSAISQGRKYRWGMAGGFAAALVGLVILGTTIWSDAVRSFAFGNASPALASVYSTPQGQRATVSLPDGSFVHLNVGSRLEVPASFANGTRTVRLTGEAMFTVTHHDRVPFTVLTGSAATRVLGTVFSVRRYPLDSATVVSVREGRVEFQSTVLNARQEGTMDDEGKVRVQPLSEFRFDFASGILTIDDLPLSKAVIELARWYDAEIRIGDPALFDQRVGGKFVSGSISDLASTLESTLGFRVEQNVRTLTLYPE